MRSNQKIWIKYINKNLSAKTPTEGMLGNFRTQSGSLPPSGVFFPSFFINSSKVKTINLFALRSRLTGQDEKTMGVVEYTIL